MLSYFLLGVVLSKFSKINTKEVESSGKAYGPLCLQMTLCTLTGSDSDLVMKNCGNISEVLNCSSMALSQVPQLPVMGQLKKLNLSHNKLGTIPRGSLKNLKMLEVIDVSHNRILTVHEDAGFRELLHLQEIYLDNNRLGTLTLSIFTGLPQMRLVGLRNNRDLCIVQCPSCDWLCTLQGVLEVNDCNNRPDCINHFFIQYNTCGHHLTQIPSCFLLTTIQSTALQADSTHDVTTLKEMKSKQFVDETSLLYHSTQSFETTGWQMVDVNQTVGYITATTQQSSDIQQTSCTTIASDPQGICALCGQFSYKF